MWKLSTKKIICDEKLNFFFVFYKKELYWFGWFFLWGRNILRLFLSMNEVVWGCSHQGPRTPYTPQLCASAFQIGRLFQMQIELTAVWLYCVPWICWFGHQTNLLSVNRKKYLTLINRLTDSSYCIYNTWQIDAILWLAFTEYNKCNILVPASDGVCRWAHSRTGTDFNSVSAKWGWFDMILIDS